MKRDRWRAASPRSAPSRRRQARASGAQPAVCTAISRGSARHSPAATATANPCASALAKAPPPTWTNSASDVAPARRASVSPFRSPSVRAAFDRQAVVGPLHAERNRAAATAARAARTQGSPTSPARRSQTTTVAPSSPSRLTTLSSASTRDEDVERPIGGARDHRRGQRGVAAGGDRQAARAQARRRRAGLRPPAFAR